MNKIIKRFFKKEVEEPFKKSYSKDGEDILLSSFFEDMGGRNTGFYIDIGALHPYRFSNTTHFYEKGWRGINIEPTPDAIQLFDKHRPREVNLNIGIGENEEKLSFYCSDEPALNSFSKELSNERDQNTIYNIIEVKDIAIYASTKVLEQHLPSQQNIYFMSIDVEGLDLHVLKSNNWKKYRPEFIFAEDIIDFIRLGESAVYSFLKFQEYELVSKTQRTMLFKSLESA